MNLALFGKSEGNIKTILETLSSFDTLRPTVYHTMQDFVQITRARSLKLDRILFLPDAITADDDDELLSDFADYLFKNYSQVRVISLTLDLSVNLRLQRIFYGPNMVHFHIENGIKKSSLLPYVKDPVEVLRKKYEHLIPSMDREGDAIADYEDELVVPKPEAQQQVAVVPTGKQQKKKNKLFGLFSRGGKGKNKQEEEAAASQDNAEVLALPGGEEASVEDQNESQSEQEPAITSFGDDAEEEFTAEGNSEPAVDTVAPSSSYYGEVLDTSVEVRKSVFEEDEMQKRMEGLPEMDAAKDDESTPEEEVGLSEVVGEPVAPVEPIAPIAPVAPVPGAGSRRRKNPRVTEAEMAALVSELAGKGVFGPTGVSGVPVQPVSSPPPTEGSPSVAPFAGPSAAPAAPVSESGPVSPSGGSPSPAPVQPPIVQSAPVVPPAVPVVPPAVAGVGPAVVIVAGGQGVTEPKQSPGLGVFADIPGAGASDDDLFGESDSGEDEGMDSFDEVNEPAGHRGVVVVVADTPSPAQDLRVPEVPKAVILPDPAKLTEGTLVKPLQPVLPEFEEEEEVAEEPNNARSAGLTVFGEENKSQEQTFDQDNKDYYRRSRQNDIESVVYSKEVVQPDLGLPASRASEEDTGLNEPDNKITGYYVEETESVPADDSFTLPTDRTSIYAQKVMQEAVHPADLRGTAGSARTSSVSVPEPDHTGGGVQYHKDKDSSYQQDEDTGRTIPASLPDTKYTEEIYENGVRSLDLTDAPNVVASGSVAEPVNKKGSAFEVDANSTGEEESDWLDSRDWSTPIAEVQDSLTEGVILPDLPDTSMSLTTSGPVVEPRKGKTGLKLDATPQNVEQHPAVPIPRGPQISPTDLPSIRSTVDIKGGRRRSQPVTEVEDTSLGALPIDNFLIRPKKSPVAPVAAAPAPVQEPPVVPPAADPIVEPVVDPDPIPPVHQRGRPEPRRSGANRGGGVHRRGSSAATKFVVVTGDRKTGITSTAFNMAAQFSMTGNNRVLFVDFDLRTHGSLLYVGLEDIAQEEERVQNGLYRLMRSDHLQTSVYSYMEQGILFDCLLSMYGTEIDEKALDMSQKALLTQKDYTTVVIDCPFEFLPFLQDIVPYADILICTESDTKGVLNTVLELDRVTRSELITDVRFSSYLFSNSSYAITEGSIPSDFAMNMVQIGEYFGLDEADFDWSTLPVVGGAGSLNKAAFAAR